MAPDEAAKGEAKGRLRAELQVQTRIVPSCVERLRRMTSRNICGPPRPDAPVPPSPVRAGATSASSTVADGL